MRPQEIGAWLLVAGGLGSLALIHADFLRRLFKKSTPASAPQDLARLLRPPELFKLDPVVRHSEVSALLRDQAREAVREAVRDLGEQWLLHAAEEERKAREK
jgi:hypothetical protein